MAYNLYQNPLESLYRPEDEEAAYEARRPTLSALLPKPDPDMDERWRQAEQSALERSQPNTEYGVAEGVRDLAPMAIGSILDILVNKGKGLGTLAAGGMQALGDEQARRDALQKTAAAQALAIRRQRESGADRAINARHAMLREAELLERMREKLKDPATSEGQKRKLEAEIEQIQAHTGLYQQQKKDLEEYGGIKEILAAYAAQGASAAKLAELEIELRKQRSAEEKNRIDAQKQSDKTSNENAEWYYKTTEGAHKQAQALRDLDLVLKDYMGRDIPNVGEFDSRVTNKAHYQGQELQDANKIGQFRDAITTFLTLEATGKQSREQEAQTAKAIYGMRPGASEQEFLEGVNFARRRMREVLAGASAGKEADARKVLDKMNLTDFVFGPMVTYQYSRRGQQSQQQPQQQQAPGSPPQQSTQTQPQGPQPQPTPASTTPATPVTGGTDEQSLWDKVPQEQREAVRARLEGLSTEQRITELRRLTQGQAAEPSTTTNRVPGMQELASVQARIATLIESLPERRKQQIKKWLGGKSPADQAWLLQSLEATTPQGLSASLELGPAPKAPTQRPRRPPKKLPPGARVRGGGGP